MTGETLTSDEVAAWAGVTFRQLDNWQRCGYVHGPAGRGSGRPRRWTPDETRRVRLFARLVRAGLTLQTASDLTALGVGAHEVAPGVTIEIGPEQ